MAAGQSHLPRQLSKNHRRNAHQSQATSPHTRIHRRSQQQRPQPTPQHRSTRKTLYNDVRRHRDNDWWGWVKQIPHAKIMKMSNREAHRSLPSTRRLPQSKPRQPRMEEHHQATHETNGKKNADKKRHPTLNNVIYPETPE